MIERRFSCYYYFQQWTYINLGIHVDLTGPNIELHLPFGFVRIGWMTEVTVVVDRGRQLYGWDGWSE